MRRSAFPPQDVPAQLKALAAPPELIVGWNHLLETHQDSLDDELAISDMWYALRPEPGKVVVQQWRRGKHLATWEWFRAPDGMCWAYEYERRWFDPEDNCMLPIPEPEDD